MKKRFYIEIAVRFLLFFPTAGILIFLPAGTFNYWDAWVFLVVFFACNLALTGYLVFKDPKFGG